MEDNNIKRIEKYLCGEMSPEEIKQFEADLLCMPNLENELNLQKEVHGFLRNYTDRNDFRKVLDEVHHKFVAEFNAQEQTSELQTEPVFIPEIKKRNNTRRIYWSAAAVILAVLTFAVVLKFASKGKTNDELFAEYYQTNEPLNIRSSDSLQNDISSDCMKKYSDKNYSEALTCFKNILSLDKNNHAASFFSGISYIETKDYKNAISNLNLLIVAQNMNFYQPSVWYSGLCYLKINNKDSALVCFKKLSREKGSFKTQAEKIVKELE